MNDVDYRKAGPEDVLAISILLSGAFDGPDEGVLVQALRESGELPFEMVAEEAGRILAYVGFPALRSPAGWLALAPLAVRHDMQGMGVGSELVRRALDQIRQDGYPAVLVLGDPSYYNRFGFSVDAAANVDSPYPAEFLGLYAIDPKIAGSSVEAVYPQAFSDV